MSELDEMAADVRAIATGANWPDPADVRRRGDQRTVRQRAVSIVAVVVVLAIAVPAAFLLRARPPAEPPPVGTTVTPTPERTTPIPVAPRLVAHGSIRGVRYPRSLAVRAGSLWIAFNAPALAQVGDQPGPGELVRVDQHTLRTTATWPVVGSPVAIAVSDRYVWVAGDIADGRPPAQGANHVQQFDLTGRLVHTYDITNPSALALQGEDAVWVEYGWPGTGPALVARLHDGVADSPVRLGGANATDGKILAACADGVYAVSEGDTAMFVDRISAGQPEGRVSLPLGLPQIGCDPAGGVVVVNTGVDHSLGGSTISWPGFGGPQRPAIALPDFTHFLGTDESVLWLAQTDSANHWRAAPTDLNTLATGGSIAIPDGGLTIVSGQTLWTVAVDPDPSGAWAITAIDP